MDAPWRCPPTVAYLSGQSFLAVQTGAGGAAAFVADLQGCSGWLHPVGAALPPLAGVTAGSLAQGIEALIPQDPNAYWDASQGAVVSGSIVTPRVIALPVFAPAAFMGSAAGVPPVVVKIVGFFVSHQTNGVVYGYLSGRSRLKTADVTARLGESASLSATFIGPGSPIVGVLVEFLVNDTVAAIAHTDGTGTAVVPHDLVQSRVHDSGPVSRSHSSPAR